MQPIYCDCIATAKQELVGQSPPLHITELILEEEIGWSEYQVQREVLTSRVYSFSVWEVSEVNREIAEGNVHFMMDLVKHRSNGILLLDTCRNILKSGASCWVIFRTPTDVLLVRDACTFVDSDEESDDDLS